VVLGFFFLDITEIVGVFPSLFLPLFTTEA